MLSTTQAKTGSVDSSLGNQGSTLYRQIALTLLVICLTTFMSLASASGGELERALTKCSLISNDGQRLKCLDRIVQSVVRPMDLRSRADQVNREDVSAKTALGQKYLPKAKVIDSKKAHHYSLVAAERDKKKRWVFSFEGGQVWRQVEPRYFSMPKKLPTRVDILAGVFGSFDLRVDGQRGTAKVKRLR